jgi:hypothetical protein
MRRARYWRNEPTFTYRRSRLRPLTGGCVRRDSDYVEGSDFDEFRAQLKQDDMDRAENWFGRR